MEEFIKAMKTIDNETRKEIIRKVENGEKLNNYEMQYLIFFRNTIEKYRRKK